MNILLINHYAGSLRYGMEFRPHYLGREWVKKGHQVTILGASFSHLRNVQPEMGAESIVEELIDGITYRWYRTPAYKGNGVRRILNILSFVKAVALDASNIVLKFSPDIVINSSTYPLDIWPARKIANASKAKLVYEVHDLWPLTPVELGGFSRWNPFIVLMQMAEDCAYRHSNAVISMLPNAEAHMLSRGLVKGKFHYIPNGIDCSEWSTRETLPIELAEHIRSLKVHNIPIVGYAGTVGLSNSLDTLIAVAQMSRGKFAFIVVGDGPLRESLIQRCLDLKIDNLLFFPRIPKFAVPSFLEQIDIAYLGWKRNPLYRFGISPNKLMDYMLAAKPIIHAVDAGNDPVSEAHSGVTVIPENANAVYSAICDILSLDDEHRAKIGLNGRGYVLRCRTYSVLSDQFLSVLYQC